MLCKDFQAGTLDFWILDTPPRKTDEIHFKVSLR